MSSKLFKKPKFPCKFVLDWTWTDIGLVLRFFKNTEYFQYTFSIDIQILWAELWIQFYRRDAKTREQLLKKLNN